MCASSLARKVPVVTEILANSTGCHFFIGHPVVPQAVYCSCYDTVRLRQSQRTVYAAAQARVHGLLSAALQPNVTIVCHLIAFICAIHVVTR